jgi:hypothetical protein
VTAGKLVPHDAPGALNLPSVEDRLREIRRTLALTIVVQRALTEADEDDLTLSDSVKAQAWDLLMDLSEDAWMAAETLSQALPQKMLISRIVDDEEERGA